MTRFRKALQTRRRKAAVAIALSALIPATALAYFLATLTPTDSYTHTHVGAAPAAEQLAITYSTPTGGPISPGAGTETVLATISNGDAAPVQLTTLSVVLGHLGGCCTDGGILDGVTGLYVPACLASWFTVTSNVAGGLPAVIQPGGHVTDTITTALLNEGVDQSSCENTQPQINLVTG
jgi:hypothetical protein